MLTRVDPGGGVVGAVHRYFRAMPILPSALALVVTASFKWCGGAPPPPRPDSARASKACTGRVVVDFGADGGGATRGAGGGERRPPPWQTWKTDKRCTKAADKVYETYAREVKPMDFFADLGAAGERGQRAWLRQRWGSPCVCARALTAEAFL